MNSLIEEHGLDNPEQIYENVLSFDDLKKTNVAFLCGKISRTPYHHMPICEETIPLVDKLVKVNEYGFFSMEGQPAIKSGGILKMSWFDSCGNLCSNWFYETHQKSFISGIMESHHVDNFISFLKTKPVYFVIFGFPYKIIFNNFPHDHYNVTKTRYNKYENKISESEWCHISNINNDDDYKLMKFEEYPNIDKFIKTNCVSVDIASYEYNDEYSVENLLIEYFESINKSRQVH